MHQKIHGLIVNSIRRSIRDPTAAEMRVVSQGDQMNKNWYQLFLPW